MIVNNFSMNLTQPFSNFFTPKTTTATTTTTTRNRVKAHLEDVVVMPVHVTGDEVQHGDVHDVQQLPPLDIFGPLSYHFAVPGIYLPIGLALLAIRPPPRMHDRPPFGLRRQERA